MSSPKSAKLKTRMDVWSVMLIVSLLAMLMGCLMLYLELSRYGSFATWWKVS